MISWQTAAHWPYVEAPFPFLPSIPWPWPDRYSEQVWSSCVLDNIACGRMLCLCGLARDQRAYLLAFLHVSWQDIVRVLSGQLRPNSASVFVSVGHPSCSDRTDKRKGGCKNTADRSADRSTVTRDWRVRAGAGACDHCVTGQATRTRSARFVGRS